MSCVSYFAPRSYSLVPTVYERHVAHSLMPTDARNRDQLVRGTCWVTSMSSTNGQSSPSFLSRVVLRYARHNVPCPEPMRYFYRQIHEHFQFVSQQPTTMTAPTTVVQLSMTRGQRMDARAS